MFNAKNLTFTLAAASLLASACATDTEGTGDPSNTGAGAAMNANGAGATGNVGAGNAANPGAGNAANPGAGNAANPGAGNAANPGAGNAANPGAGNAANPGAGNAGNVGAGNAANPGAGNAGNVGAGNAGNMGAGNAGNVGAGNAGNVGAGNAGNVGAGNEGNVGAGNEGNVGAGNAGNVPTGDVPGYYTTGSWQGCSWTSPGTVGDTTIVPQDFVDNAPGDPFCISGTVAADEMYESVAIMGFNVNETDRADCALRVLSEDEQGPPTVTPTADGIAVNFVKQGADTSFTWRVQLQGPDGHKQGDIGAANRWCATITETQGKIFVPYSDFNTACWDGTGTDYNGEPISAVVFLVPGDPAATPFDFCVNGFVEGSSAEDAPDGSAVAGDQVGTVGGTGDRDLDFDRAKVTVDGEQYIIQNNNWGNPDGTDLILSYVNNSFEVTEGSGSGASAPASFPSIFIGANGDTAGGTRSTSTTDNLPRQVSQITSAQTTFSWGGSTGSFNATYDVWFANSPPSARYDDGIDGFMMVWLHKPGDKQPIGSVVDTVTVAGKTWDVWQGPRGDGPAGYNDAPVVSYVATAEMNSFSFDLKEFMDNASQYGISGSMYLTDVFAGFEIWNGGAGGGLAVKEFSIKVE